MSVLTFGLNIRPLTNWGKGTPSSIDLLSAHQMTDKDLYTDIFVFYLDPVGKQIGNVCYEHRAKKGEKEKALSKKK